MPATYVKVAEVMKSYPSLTQPYLVVGDDGKLYILKHAKSQQDLLTMAAEYIATKFGVMSNVPVLDCTIIEVDEVALELIRKFGDSVPPNWAAHSADAAE
ncbi:HipA family kinase [Deinococcus actinosclerus]|uniref:HipA family kinase n=1 Tax=Deinococcus actinosclerus TaxID=1768108 RepID=UPI0012FC6AE7|nr:HipA family kinase [Deinococcus actinosclerus]